MLRMAKSIEAAKETVVAAAMEASIDEANEAKKRTKGKKQPEAKPVGAVDKSQESSSGPDSVSYRKPSSLESLLPYMPLELPLDPDFYRPPGTNASLPSWITLHGHADSYRLFNDENPNACSVM